MPRGSAYVLILLALGLALLAGAIGGDWERFPPTAYASSIEPVRPGQEDSIRRAVFADRRLWLLSDAGEVWTVREDNPGAERVQAPDVTFDICVQRGLPVIATAPLDQLESWRIRRWQDGQWAEVATVRVEDDGFVAIACEPDRLTLLTSRRLVELGPERRVVTLSHRVPTRPMSVVLPTPTHLYVGLNAGEWGGGLQRIDRRTGVVRTLERNVTGKLCDGPLNPSCDPVNGLAPLSRKPGCVVAAVGLVHMSGSGRLVEICEDRIASLHSEPCPGDRKPSFCTTPFFGIIASDDGLLAVAPDKLVSLDANGRNSDLAAPSFQPHGPFQVSFARSYVIVKTSANQRHSLSGSTPLIVPR